MNTNPISQPQSEQQLQPTTEEAQHIENQVTSNERSIQQKQNNQIEEQPEPCVRPQGYGVEEAIREDLANFGQGGDIHVNPQIDMNAAMDIIKVEQVQPLFFTIPNIIDFDKQEAPIQCNFCAQLLQKDKFQRVFMCDHIFCTNCLKIYFNTQISNFKLLLCPQQNCKKQVDTNSTQFKNIQSQLKQKYQLIVFRKQIEKNPNLILCPNEKCPKGYIEVKQGQKNGQCKVCRVQYCVKCRLKSHSGQCQNFEQTLIKDKFKYKKCFGCNRIVQRSQGCPHMTCKCSNQFCYYCGKKWLAPHRCIRVIAGGQLITDKLQQQLKCMRPQQYEYSYTPLSYMTKIPYYIATTLILLLYLTWCVSVLCIIIACLLVCSCLSGYFALQYKVYQSGSFGRVVFILFIAFLPIGFIVGWIGVFGAGFISVLPKYMELALSARLFPCYVL